MNVPSAALRARFSERRKRLAERVPGPIVLRGTPRTPRNLPISALPFRQDSTVLYFTGCDLPDATAILEDGALVLVLPEPSPDDPIWHGPVASAGALAERFGADRVVWRAELPAGARTLADPELVDAVIALRRPKDADELAEVRAAVAGTARAFRLAMSATRPGSTERGLWTLFEAALRMEELVPAYETILSQSGEILHTYDHSQALAAGRLLLLDGGGERPSGYGCDVTRTWPVSGRFEGRQGAAYDAVLEAQRAAIDRCRPGEPYRSVHDTAARALARWLVDERLLRGEVDGLVERGAHAIFFPHGVGHLLGLDVHDLESFGDRAAYPPGATRSEQFGTRYLRLSLPLEAGWIVTVEPGFYVVPAILRDAALVDRFASDVDFEAARAWEGFGGIRIEDDVLVTDAGPDVLTAAIPKAPGDLRAVVGAGPTAEQRLA